MHSSLSAEDIAKVALRCNRQRAKVVAASCHTRRRATSQQTCSVYILKCYDGTHYTGIAHNIAARFRAHLHGDVTYTRHKQPLQLLCYVTLKTRREAAELERRVKKKGASRWLRSHTYNVILPLEKDANNLAT